MDSLTKFALDILRDRNFSRLDEDVRDEVLSLFLDDHHKPSKEGRRMLALNADLLAKQLGEPRLEVLSMDVLMACDKAEVRDVLAKMTDILQAQV
ncbi:hypothetical protein [Enterobacter asburiae]|uniref:hypothetical protein n=1 Tax=Enterobacter asburiae TaxID=61645 RepID=UPI0011D2A014|nr:hypothetical protein [Enterobacter asburiae]